MSKAGKPRPAGKSGGRAKAPAAHAAAEISKREWDPIRQELLRMREELTRSDRQKKEIDVGTRDVGDEADEATNSLEKEMLFELSDNERGMLDQIEGALRKMEKGVLFIGPCRSNIYAPHDLRIITLLIVRENRMD